MILNIPKFPLMLFEVCAIICLTSSSLMHIFWVKSKRACENLHKLDIVGIVVMICGSSVSMTYFQFYCSPGIRKLYISMNILCAMSVIYTLTVGCHILRENLAFSVVTFIFQAFLSLIPYAHWIMLKY